jgi:tetratricopeptide (TPR) repeat protein
VAARLARGLPPALLQRLGAVFRSGQAEPGLRSTRGSRRAIPGGASPLPPLPRRLLQPLADGFRSGGAEPRLRSTRGFAAQWPVAARLARGLAAALLLAGCATRDPIARGEAAFRAGDLTAAVAIWSAVSPRAEAYREAQARIARATALGSRLGADRVRQAEAFRGEGRYAEAVLAYREALALGHNDPDVEARLEGLVRRLAREKAAGRARVAARLSAGDLAGAYDELVVLRILDPFDAEVHATLEALEPARAAAARRSLEEAKTLAGRGHLAAARAAAARALDYEPVAPAAETLIGDLMRRERLGLEDGARGVPVPGGRAASAAAEAALRRSHALREAGQTVEALREVARAAEANPRDARLATQVQELRNALAGSTEAFFIQGIRHYRAERMQQAINEWQTVLLIDPTHEKARLYVDKARRVLEKLDAIQREEVAAQPAAPATR